MDEKTKEHPTHRVQVMLRRDEAEALQRLAQRSERSMSAMGRLAIRRFMSEQTETR